MPRGNKMTLMVTLSPPVPPLCSLCGRPIMIPTSFQNLEFSIHPGRMHRSLSGKRLQPVTSMTVINGRSVPGDAFVRASTLPSGVCFLPWPGFCGHLT